jgi:hypothetical protein
MQLPANTAGGEFHPALRTLPRRNGRDGLSLRPGGRRPLPGNYWACWPNRISAAGGLKGPQRYAEQPALTSMTSSACFIT